MGYPRIFISSDPDALESRLEGLKSVTIEAEYGERCVEGSVLTLAHHGPRSNNPAPCLHTEKVDCEAIGLSHIDLDTMGGILAVIGEKPEAPEFWELAAFVDINGPHKLAQSGASEKTIRQLYAVWAWQQANRLDTRTQPGEVKEFSVEELVIPLFKIILDNILGGYEYLLQKGDEFRAQTEALNESSFVELSQGVIVRVSDSFTNHLYNSPDGEIAKAVVAFSTKTGGITVSLESPIEGFSVAEFLQDLFGPEAGGHAGIGGTPRGVRQSLAALCRTTEKLREALN